MVIEILNLIKAWPQEYQLSLVIFSLALAFILVYTVLYGIWTVVKRILRIPAPKIIEKEADKQPCNNEIDNLTGLCLRKGGCRTQEECDYMVYENQK